MFLIGPIWKLRIRSGLFSADQTTHGAAAVKSGRRNTISQHALRWLIKD